MDDDRCDHHRHDDDDDDDCPPPIPPRPSFTFAANRCRGDSRHGDDAIDVSQLSADEDTCSRDLAADEVFVNDDELSQRGVSQCELIDEDTAADIADESQQRGDESQHRDDESEHGQVKRELSTDVDDERCRSSRAPVIRFSELDDFGLDPDLFRPECLELETAGSDKAPKFTRSASPMYDSVCDDDETG